MINRLGIHRAITSSVEHQPIHHRITARQRTTTYADGVATPNALNRESNFSKAAMDMMTMAAKFMLCCVLSAVRRYSQRDGVL